MDHERAFGSQKMQQVIRLFALNRSVCISRPGNPSSSPHAPVFEFDNSSAVPVPCVCVFTNASIKLTAGSAR
eukprot:1180530-Prorocentrum_minimum.AAC.8